MASDSGHRDFETYAKYRGYRRHGAPWWTAYYAYLAGMEQAARIAEQHYRIVATDIRAAAERERVKAGALGAASGEERK